MHRLVAGSIRGPAHIEEGLPCQDAWLAVTDSRAVLAVVCDGLGSRPLSHMGSAAATRAARDAWRLWRKSSVGTVEDLVRLVEIAWRIRLGTVLAADAATTLLMYAEDGHGRAAVAQLGDGMIARRSLSGQTERYPSQSEPFGMTQALGTPHLLTDWRYALVPPLSEGELLLLATDGVSDDLEPATLSEFATWIREEVGSRPHPNRALRTELRNWPVPGHRDDKTLLAIWKEGHP